MTRTGGAVKKITGHIKRDTGKAILMVPELDTISLDEQVTPNAYTQGIWFPVSQIREIHKSASEDDLDVIVVTSWICQQKGIEL